MKTLWLVYTQAYVYTYLVDFVNPSYCYNKGIFIVIINFITIMIF